MAERLQSISLSKFMLLYLLSLVLAGLSFGFGGYLYAYAFKFISLLREEPLLCTSEQLPHLHMLIMSVLVVFFSISIGINHAVLTLKNGIVALLIFMALLVFRLIYLQLCVYYLKVERLSLLDLNLHVYLILGYGLSMFYVYWIRRSWHTSHSY